ncbi:MAG: hypothetical protein ACRDN0_22840 [Trebonia sp.]
MSYPHRDEPYRETGVKLGDHQFALGSQWEQAGRLALVGMGVEPGLSDVFARPGPASSGRPPAPSRPCSGRTVVSR